MSRGIDYGMGMTNVDRETGIRFGVIPMNSLGDYAHESFEADYGDPTCPKCGGSLVDYDDDTHGDYHHISRGFRSCADYVCENCQVYMESAEAYGDEPTGHTLAEGGYAGSLDNYGDVFLLRSPYFTRAGFCSPCAPGACHLESPCDDGERCYCFGHDWFDGDVAPYPVYSVATGELVPPPVK